MQTKCVHFIDVFMGGIFLGHPVYGKPILKFPRTWQLALPDRIFTIRRTSAFIVVMVSLAIGRVFAYLEIFD